MQKRTSKPRPGIFRPTVETLECRMQPGTVLGLGGAALDLNAGAALDNTPSDADVSLHRLISRDSDAGLRVGHGDAGAVVTYQAAPGQVSTVSTATVQTGSQFGLPV